MNEGKRNEVIHMIAANCTYVPIERSFTCKMLFRLNHYVEWIGAGAGSA